MVEQAAIHPVEEVHHAHGRSAGTALSMLQLYEKKLAKGIIAGTPA